jgi:hypothetical protein
MPGQPDGACAGSNRFAEKVTSDESYGGVSSNQNDLFGKLAPRKTISGSRGMIADLGS